MTIENKLKAIAQNQQEIYNTRYEKGYNDGKRAEYDQFWDIYQDGGNRTSYFYAFYSGCWNDINFKPKWNITVGGGASAAFQQCNITDLAGILQKQNVVLDTSNCTSLQQMFQSSTITHIPEIDGRKATSMMYTFACDQLVTIDKLTVSETTTDYRNTFRNTFKLQNLLMKGTIVADIDLHYSPLTKESIESVVAALSGTATGLTVSFNKTAVNVAFETAEGLSNGSASEEWASLIASKSNWTISLT